MGERIEFKTCLPGHLNYNLDKGWYLTSSPTITADWEAESGEKWTVPIGGGVGRLMRFGKQPVDFKLAGYYNVEKPKFGPDWSLQFQVKLLFPKKFAKKNDR